jgi:hypothetical protein
LKVDWWSADASIEFFCTRNLGLPDTRTEKLASGTEIRNRCNSLLWSPLIAISAAAFAVEIPFFFRGTPSGHDVEFHLYSWLEVMAQWKQGIVFPRWAALANFGYGEPRFVFYPPASWVLGSLISKVFPWTIASCVFLWIALTLAGASMFMLARRWLSRRDAMFAAVLYAVNPYHLVIVYWRSAFAELLAASLVPLLLLFVWKAADEGRCAIMPLGLVLAAAWLTNAPAAVMIHYSLALLVVFLAWRKRSGRVALVAGAAILLGAALASFYLVPAIYEQRWVQIENAVSAGARPGDNFLFVHTTDADHDAFNRLISWVAVLEIVAVAGLLWVARAWKTTRTEPALSLPKGAFAPNVSPSDRSCGVGNRMQCDDAALDNCALEGSAEDAVHAVSLAMAALPEYVVLSARCSGVAALVDADGGLRREPPGNRGRMVPDSGSVVGHCGRSARNAGQHGDRHRIRRDG